MSVQTLHQPSQSTAAVLTAHGRGAVATIRLCGGAETLDRVPQALFRAANGRPMAHQPAGRVVFGHWGQVPVEEVVVCRLDESTTEIHCHGGDAAVRRVLTDLETVGYRVVEWPQQVSHAKGLLEAECLKALSQAPTLRTADILLDQYAGTLRKGLDAMCGSVPAGELGKVELQGESSLLPRHPPYPPLLRGGNAIAGLLEWGEFGLHLSRPWQVVLTGRPNVGKSSLINALLGYTRSIVYDQPGTTRDVVTAETAFAGWPVQLADTAGLRSNAGAIEVAGIIKAQSRLAQADCRVILIDQSQTPATDDLNLLRAWPDAIVVAHKADRPDVWGVEIPQSALRISSLTGAGVQQLADAIVARLVPSVPTTGTAIPVTQRQIDVLRQAHTAELRGDESALQRAFVSLLS